MKNHRLRRFPFWRSPAPARGDARTCEADRGQAGRCARVAGGLLAVIATAGLGGTVAIAGSAALAAEMPAFPQGCAADAPEQAELKAIGPRGDLALADGRVVTFADIGWMDAGDNGPDPMAGPGAWATLLPGAPEAGRLLRLHPRHVTSRSKGPAVDRWGRMPAAVELLPVSALAEGEGNAEEVPGWLEGALIASGAARVMPLSGPWKCIDALLALEAAAREQGRGIWAKADGGAGGKVHDAGDAKLAEKTTGRFAIVEGRVISVGASNSTHYLNFGRDWSTDFTVTVRKTDLARFAEAGRHPAGLAGHRLRVRGWIRTWNGAAIDARHPGDIEVLDGRD